jgi:hypothetical protein
MSTALPVVEGLDSNVLVDVNKLVRLARAGCDVTRGGP